MIRIVIQNEEITGVFDGDRELTVDQDFVIEYPDGVPAEVLEDEEVKEETTGEEGNSESDNESEDENSESEDEKKNSPEEIVEDAGTPEETSVVEEAPQVEVVPGDKCLSCNGTGLKTEDILCPDCDGSGKVKTL